MTKARISISCLFLLFTAAILAGLIAPAGYEEQFREYPDEAPSSRFPLGTDELGRDRLSRLLYGTRVSLLLAPSAAAVATAIALSLGLIAASFRGIPRKMAIGLTDVFSSIPSLLILFVARALLPLNVPPGVSVSITFALLALVGWTSGVRVISAAVAQARDSQFMQQARAAGCSPLRIALVHVAPAIRPVLIAQFCLLIPLFLLAEANLGMLGLGVTEPLPSWGNLLAELQGSPGFWRKPWLLAPAALLIAALLSLQNLLVRKNAS